jgi:hypothetical protein
MSKAAVEHRDKLGRLLKVGDCVAYPDSNSLQIGMIKRVTDKMAMVAELGIDKNTSPSWYNRNGRRKYPADLVLLEGPDVIVYMLKHGS